MMGYNPKTDVWFCDLNCNVCQGNASNPCLLVGMFSMSNAQIMCWRDHIFLYEFMKPKGYWADRIVGTPDDYPISSYPKYDEKEN